MKTSIGDIEIDLNSRDALFYYIEPLKFSLKFLSFIVIFIHISILSAVIVALLIHHATYVQFFLGVMTTMFLLAFLAVIANAAGTSSYDEVWTTICVPNFGGLRSLIGFRTLMKSSHLTTLVVTEENWSMFSDDQKHSLKQYLADHQNVLVLYGYRLFRTLKSRRLEEQYLRNVPYMMDAEEDFGKRLSLEFSNYVRYALVFDNISNAAEFKLTYL